MGLLCFSLFGQLGTVQTGFRKVHAREGTQDLQEPLHVLGLSQPRKRRVVAFLITGVQCHYKHASIVTRKVERASPNMVNDVYSCVCQHAPLCQSLI